MIRIIDWDKRHENARSRQLKNLPWIAQPVKIQPFEHGLFSAQTNLELIGLYSLLVRMAANAPHPRTGTVVNEIGAPHTPLSIATTLSIGERKIVELLELLASGPCPCIDLSCESWHPVADPSPIFHVEEKTEEKEENKKDEKKKRVMVDYSPEFTDFWKAYPESPRGKPNKQKAWTEWQTLLPEDNKVVLADVLARKESQDWTKEDGKYIPNPENYLKAAPWRRAITKNHGVNADLEGSKRNRELDTLCKFLIDSARFKVNFSGDKTFAHILAELDEYRAELLESGEVTDDGSNVEQILRGVAEHNADLTGKKIKGMDYERGDTE